MLNNSKGEILLKIRQTTPEDYERINELNALSYGFDKEVFAERFKERFAYQFDENYCIEVDGIIAANIRLISFDQNVRGKIMKMGGIAMVVTDPLYRRKGYSREIMKFLIDKMGKENFAVSNLYPFKDTFYAAFGYVNANSHVFMKFNPKFLIRWKNLPEGYRIERLSLSEGYKYYKEIYNTKIKDVHGGIIRSEKRWKLWEEKWPGWFVVAFNSKGKVEGILRYSTKGFMEGFSWSESGKMQVNDIKFLTPQARHALYHYMYLYADQVVEVTMPIFPNESEIYPWLQGYYMTELKTENIWMARIINVKLTLDDLPVETDGKITVKISDDHCPQNNQTYIITSQKGKLSVEELGEKPSKLEMTQEGLASLVYGLLTTDNLEVFKWIKNVSKEEKELLDAWFPLLPPVLTEGF